MKSYMILYSNKLQIKDESCIMSFCIPCKFNCLAKSICFFHVQVCKKKPALQETKYQQWMNLGERWMNDVLNFRWSWVGSPNEPTNNDNQFAECMFFWDCYNKLQPICTSLNMDQPLYLSKCFFWMFLPLILHHRNVVDWKKNPSSSPCKDQWDEAGVESVDLVVRGGRDLKLQNCKQESWNDPLFLVGISLRKIVQTKRGW